MVLVQCQLKQKRVGKKADNNITMFVTAFFLCYNSEKYIVTLTN